MERGWYRSKTRFARRSLQPIAWSQCAFELSWPSLEAQRQSPPSVRPRGRHEARRIFVVPRTKGRVCRPRSPLTNPVAEASRNYGPAASPARPRGSRSPRQVRRTVKAESPRTKEPPCRSHPSYWRAAGANTRHGWCRVRRSDGWNTKLLFRSNSELPPPGARVG